MLERAEVCAPIGSFAEADEPVFMERDEWAVLKKTIRKDLGTLEKAMQCEEVPLPPTWSTEQNRVQYSLCASLLVNDQEKCVHPPICVMKFQRRFLFGAVHTTSKHISPHRA
ncbi:unnamed protein product [Haemonchus placei]|uniref:Uncharacterized protein n=1 Tax=Haemonchus placei TaxID=6290 RepID=A0A0N4WL48_HAEPC|nr:unnamed protein product [Haemonchus placei]